MIADGFKGYLQFIPAVKAALVKSATAISVYGVSKNNVKESLKNVFPAEAGIQDNVDFAGLRFPA